ncbi:MAG: hypothetical protein AVDCRST_MAG68-2713, partial [uncultured Gemmatimonadetes bacterium]
AALAPSPVGAAAGRRAPGLPPTARGRSVRSRRPLQRGRDRGTVADDGARLPGPGRGAPAGLLPAAARQPQPRLRGPLVGHAGAVGRALPVRAARGGDVRARARARRQLQHAPRGVPGRAPLRAPAPAHARGAGVGTARLRRRVAARHRAPRAVVGRGRLLPLPRLPVAAVEPGPGV